MTENEKHPTSELDVLVVGAGFSGLYALHELRKAGFNAKIFEAGSNVGGTWYWNRYPGARTDSEFSIYQLSMEELWKDWNWTERFPGRNKLIQYFQYMSKKLDLGKDILFNTRMTTAHFDTNMDRWIVSTETGLIVRPRFMILYTGFASKPYTPAYKGLDSFKGIMHHTAFWPEEGVVTKGLRVGIIGTGATGVQVIQETALECEHLTVFQRTPNIAIAMVQRKLDIGTQTKLKETYPEMFRGLRDTLLGFHHKFLYVKAREVSKERRTQIFEDLWQKGGFYTLLGSFADVTSNEEANAELYQFWRTKVIPRIKDPKLHEKLAPEVAPHPFGAKRHSLEQNYYDVFNQPNVSLIDVNENPIIEVTETGIRTKDGREYEFDVLILATGFDAVTGSISQIGIKGTDGVLIGDKWKKKLSTYLGLTTAGFPNMFFPYGPHGPTALCNGPVCAELQSNWVIACLKSMREQGRTRIEAELDAEKKWTDEVNEAFNKGLLSRAKSPYTGANIPGKNIESMNFTEGLPLYIRKIEGSAANDYAGFNFFSSKEERVPPRV